jgi:hypothetical protein
MRHAILALALAVAGCTTDPLAAPLVSVVRIDVSGAPADGIMLDGANRQLAATVLGPQDTVLTDAAVAWSSSDDAIATVNEAGLVTANAVGDVTITAEADGITGTAFLSIREGTTIPNGGTRFVTLLDGLLRLSIHNSAGPTGMVIHARRALTWPPNARIVEGTVIELGPDGIELVNPMTASITFTLAAVPAGERAGLRLHGVDAQGAWVELPSAAVDLDLLRVSAAVTRLSRIAIFRPEPEA